MDLETDVRKAEASLGLSSRTADEWQWITDRLLLAVGFLMGIIVTMMAMGVLAWVRG